MSSGLDAAASLLDQARGAADELEARLLLAAAVEQTALTVGGRAILTGGTAVDFYAAGALGTSTGYPEKWRPSGDVDVVVMSVDGWKVLQPDMFRAFDKLGLKPRRLRGDEGRGVDIPDFPFVLEIVGSELNRDPKAERVITVVLDGQWPVPIRGPEDIVLSYGESGWDTRHSQDWERALAVYRAMRDRMDTSYLFAEADRRKVRRVLDAIVRQQPSPWREPR